MKKRILLIIIITLMMLCLLPGGAAMAVTFGFNTEEPEADNTISDTNGGYTLQITSSNTNDYVTNWTMDTTGELGFSVSLMNGFAVCVTGPSGNEKPSGSVTVSLTSGSIFSLTSFICGNAGGTDNVRITAGSATELFSVPGFSEALINPSAAFQGITSFTLSWEEIGSANYHAMYFDDFNITPITNPVITDQPDDVTAANGSNTSFSVTAIGNALTYQWQVDTSGTGSSFTNISNGGVYGGATTASLSITGVTLGMNHYQYRCIVTAEGIYSTTSNSAALTLPAQAPTNIILDNASIAENTASGTRIGGLTSADSDSSIFTYSLVNTGTYPDNAYFTVTGSDLKLNTVPDFENKSSYSICIQTQDDTGLTYAKAFTVSITDVNEAPTDITISNTSVAENSASGTTIGILSGIDPDAGTVFTYALAAGAGDTDNSSFTISGNALKLAVVPDYESKSSYQIRVRVSDGLLYYEKNFTISITDVNEAPTGINLSGSSVLEHSAVGTTIGTFSGVDPDAGSAFTYSFITGSGDTDNGSFIIDGNTLKLGIVPDYEIRDSYSIRVRVSDGALTYDRPFTITILDGNDPPTDITITGGSVAENAAPGSAAGTLGASDPNPADTFTYSLAVGAGDADNASFSITGNVLKLEVSADYETKSSYNVRIRATDNGGLYYEKAFVISVTNVNEAPTDILLSNNAISENSAVGTVLGTLSGVDPDAGTTFTYSLVSGTGSTDNASFTIDGNELKLAVVPDYETKSSYTIRIRVSDGSLTFEKQFTVTVLDGNDAPTDIWLSNTSVAENTASGTAVATIDTVDPNGGSFIYSLVNGTGSTDNGSFTISGNSLRLATVPDYETRASYEIRIRTTDDGGMYYEKAFVITVTDVNEAPTDIALSNKHVSENSPSGTAIGTLSGTDPDAGSVFTYSLVSGTGDTDNASFTITGNTLQTASEFNYEARNSYSIRIRVTDADGLSYEKQFTISVDNVNEAPTDISLSSTAVAENTAIGTTVGTLSGTDPDAGTVFTYTLAAGAGDTDNSSFTISGNELKLAIVPDYEAKANYEIRVRVSDGSLTYEKQFIITITDGNEIPTDIILAGSSIAENTASGTTITTISSSDPDSSSFTYTLADGAGSTDNASFTISGNELKLAVVPDFESKASYNIRIRTTDDGGLSFEKAFVITVNDVNEAPSNITISKTSIAENSAIGTTIGTFAGVDEDASDSLSYTLVTGAGSDDNDSFTLTGNALKSAGNLDYETKRTYSIRVRVTDAGGLYYEKAFTITVTDVNETPPSQPQETTVEKLPLDVTNGTTDSSVVKIEAERTTTPDGVIKDSITFGKEKAAETIEKLKQKDAEAVRIVAPASGVKVSEVSLTIPSNSLELLSNTNLNLELETEDARISIPNTSIENASETMKEDLYFKVKPVVNEDEQQDLTDRAKNDGMLVQLLGDNLSVIGSPVEIETNMPQTTVDIILPLTGITIPESESEREELLSKLAVYIEHSDGEKEVIRGEIVEYKKGVYGLKFSVSKFSTFIIVKDESGVSGQCEVLDVKSPADTSINGYFLISKVPYKTAAVKLSITVSKGAAWKLYSDKACTKAIGNDVKLKAGLNKAYIKVTAEDGVSYKVYTVYIIKSKEK